jgi:ribosome-binding protein aMBF1 (putative translation factor)
VDVNHVDTNNVETKGVETKCVDLSTVDIKRLLGDALAMNELDITAAQLELRQLLADNVRRFRNARKVSQEGLAALAGLHRTYVSQVERKVVNTSVDNIAKLALALQIHAGELLREPEMSGEKSASVGKSGHTPERKGRRD